MKLFKKIILFLIIAEFVLLISYNSILPNPISLHIEGFVYTTLDGANLFIPFDAGQKTYFELYGHLYILDSTFLEINCHDPYTVLEVLSRYDIGIRELTSNGAQLESVMKFITNSGMSYDKIIGIIN